MVVIVIVKFRNIVNLFKTEDDYKETMSEALAGVQQFGRDGKDAVVGLLFIISLISGLGYIIFYTISMVYVANIWFSIFSALQIVWTVKGVGKNLQTVSKMAKSETPTKPKTRHVMVNVVVELAYIGYLLCFIMQKW